MENPIQNVDPYPYHNRDRDGVDSHLSGTLLSQEIKGLVAALRGILGVSYKMSSGDVYVVPRTDQVHENSLLTMSENQEKKPKYLQEDLERNACISINELTIQELSDKYNEEKGIEFLVKKSIEHFTLDETEKTQGCQSLTSILAMMEAAFALMAADSRLSKQIAGTTRRIPVHDGCNKIVEVQEYIFISGSGVAYYLDKVKDQLPGRFEKTFSVRFSRLQSTMMDVALEMALEIGSILTDTGEDPRKAGLLDFVVIGAVQNSVGAYRITKVEGVIWDFVVEEATHTMLKVGSGSESMDKYVERHPQDKFVNGENAVMFSQKCIEYASKKDPAGTGGDIDVVVVTKGELEDGPRREGDPFVYRRKPGRRLFTYYVSTDEDGKKVYKMHEWPGGRKNNLGSKKKVNAE